MASLAVTAAHEFMYLHSPTLLDSVHPREEKSLSAYSWSLSSSSLSSFSRRGLLSPSNILTDFEGRVAPIYVRSSRFRPDAASIHQRSSHQRISMMSVCIFLLSVSFINTAALISMTNEYRRCLPPSRERSDFNRGIRHRLVLCNILLRSRTRCFYKLYALYQNVSVKE